MNYERLKNTSKILYKAIILVTAVTAVLALYALARDLPVPGSHASNTASAPGGAASGSSDPQGEHIVMRDDLFPNAQSFYKKIEAEIFTVSGERISLSSYRGRPLALLYWASWCPDCQVMMEDIDNLANAVEAAGAQFVMVARTGINGETPETAAAYLERNGIGYATLLDRDAVVYSALGLRWVPSVLYFSPGGSLMYAETTDFSAQAAAAGVEYANGGALKVTERFVLDHLMGSDGGVTANFTINSAGVVIPSDEELSETAGLMMLYAEGQGDKALFDKLLAFVDIYAKDGKIPWMVKDGKAGDVNATLDDLRILEALIAAHARWGGYDDATAKYALPLVQYGAPGGELRDFYDITSGAAAGTLTLCYADVKVLRVLESRFPEWEGVVDKTQSVLDGGYLRDEFALYMPRYDYEKKEYAGDFLQVSEALVTVYNLAKQRALPDATHAYLKRCLEAGPIYAGYKTDGTLADGYGYESTASYALLALTAVELGDGDMLRLSLRRMEKMRELNAGSSTNGAYLSGQGITSYTFDTVMALLAWNAADKCVLPGFALD